MDIAKPAVASPNGKRVRIPTQRPPQMALVEASRGAISSESSSPRGSGAVPLSYLHLRCFSDCVPRYMDFRREWQFLESPYRSQLV